MEEKANPFNRYPSQQASSTSPGDRQQSRLTRSRQSTRETYDGNGPDRTVKSDNTLAKWARAGLSRCIETVSSFGGREWAAGCFAARYAKQDLCLGLPNAACCYVDGTEAKEQGAVLLLHTIYGWLGQPRGSAGSENGAELHASLPLCDSLLAGAELCKWEF